MRYLMLIKHTEDYRKQTVPAGLYEAMGEFVGAGFKSGAIIDTAGLKPTVDGNRVQLRGRKITVTDGPFTETKEIIGGYALMEMKSKAEALNTPGNSWTCTASTGRSSKESARCGRLKTIHDAASGGR